MKRTTLLARCAAMAALWIPLLGETARADEVVSRELAAAKLELRGLKVGSDGSVTGAVVNGSGVPIRDVDLLVSHIWSWSDERHPGEDDPGRATYVRVAGEIPANGSVDFAYAPSPPLLKRADGSFHTTAAVQSFTEIER